MFEITVEMGKKQTNIIIRTLTFLDNCLYAFHSAFKAKATNALFIGSSL